MVEPGPHLSPDDPALTSVTESLPPVEAQYIVPAPTTDPTVANPVTHAVAVTEVDEEVVETDPDRSTGIVVAIVLLIVGLLVGVVIWLATRSDEPAKPYPCSGTGATIADWNASGVRFDNGAVAPWPRGADAGTKSALDQTCAQLGALETANAAATSTTLPSSPAASSAPTTARPSSASTALRPPITAAPAVPPTTHAQAATVPTGTPATLGNGLTLVVTGFAPDASATVQSAGGGAPPTPPSGSRYSVVSATVTNPTGGAIDPGALDLRVVDPATGATYPVSPSVTTGSPLDLARQLDAGEARTGDLVVVVPEAAGGNLQLRAATNGSSTLFALS